MLQLTSCVTASPSIEQRSEDHSSLGDVHLKGGIKAEYVSAWNMQPYKTLNCMKLNFSCANSGTVK